MGFMDKAKKMAEQAQQKLDEVQEQFGQGRQGGQPAEEGPPAGEAPPPKAEPAKESSEEGAADANPDPFKPIE